MPLNSAKRTYAPYVLLLILSFSISISFLARPMLSRFRRLRRYHRHPIYTYAAGSTSPHPALNAGTLLSEPSPTLSITPPSPSTRLFTQPKSNMGSRGESIRLHAPFFVHSSARHGISFSSPRDGNNLTCTDFGRTMRFPEAQCRTYLGKQAWVHPMLSPAGILAANTPAPAPSTCANTTVLVLDIVSSGVLPSPARAIYHELAPCTNLALICMLP